MANEQKVNSQKQTRYQRVKQILNDAQGDACPSYQGYERFWDLPLERLLEVTIYGIRMIAPAGEANFCEDNMQPAGGSRGSCCETESEGDEKSGSNVSD